MDDRWIWALAAAAGGLVLGALAGLAVRRILDRPARRPALREIAGPLGNFVFWLVVATGVVVAVAVASPESLETVPTEILNWLPTVAVAGLLLIGGYALGLTLAAAIGRPVARLSGRRNRTMERSVVVVVFAGAVILALNELGVDTTVINIVIACFSFAAALALAGIAIVGGRNVAAHVAAGRSLQRVIGVGNRIRVGDIEGVVIDLQAAHIVLDTPEGKLAVPYALIMEQSILITPG